MPGQKRPLTAPLMSSPRGFAVACGLCYSLTSAWHPGSILSGSRLFYYQDEPTRCTSSCLECRRASGRCGIYGSRGAKRAEDVAGRVLRTRDSARRGLVHRCAAGSNDIDWAEEEGYAFGEDANDDDGNDHYDTDVDGFFGDELDDYEEDGDQDEGGTEENKKPHSAKADVLDSGQGEYQDGDGGEVDGEKEQGSDDNADRLQSSLQLMEALITGEVDISSSLQDGSSTLEDEDRVVSEIARPVVQYAKRYMAPRVEYMKRQEARKKAEQDPFRDVFIYRGEYDEERDEIDMRSRHGRMSEKPPAGWDEHGPVWHGLPPEESDGFSERSRKARERWRDPEYRERILSKRKKPYAPRKPVRKDVDAKPRQKVKPIWMTKIGAGLVRAPRPPRVSTVEDVDSFLKANSITAEEAVRAYKVVSESEQRRRQSLSARHQDATKWMNDRLAKGQKMRDHMTNVDAIEARKAARSLKAKKAYEVRRRNGNGGWRPKCPLYQEKKAQREAEAAVAAASGIAQVKRPRGRPRVFKNLTEDITEKLEAWMSMAATKAASEASPLSSPPDLGMEVATLAISRTKELLLNASSEASAVERAGLGGDRSKRKDAQDAMSEGSWTVEMSNIAVAGVEAWRQAWERATANATVASAAAAGVNGDNVGDGSAVLVEPVVKRPRGRPRKKPLISDEESSSGMAVSSGSGSGIGGNKVVVGDGGDERLDVTSHKKNGAEYVGVDDVETVNIGDTFYTDDAAHRGAAPRYPQRPLSERRESNDGSDLGRSKSTAAEAAPASVRRRRGRPKRTAPPASRMNSSLVEGRQGEGPVDESLEGLIADSGSEESPVMVDGVDGGRGFVNITR